MVCSSCGKQIEGGKFCPFCGSPVTQDAPAPEVTPAAEVAPAAEAPVEAAPVAEEPAPEAPAAPVAEAPAVDTPAEPEVQPVVADAVIDASEAAAVEAASAAEHAAPVEPVTEPAPVEVPVAAVAPVPEAAPAPAPAPVEAAPAPVAEPVAPVAPVAPATPEAPKKKKSMKPLIIILSIVAAVILLAGAGVGAFFFSLSSKYSKATEAFEDGDYETSLELFTELEKFKYKDSAEMAEVSQVEIDYLKVDELIAEKDYDAALKILEDVSKFYGNKSKGKDANELIAEINTAKDAVDAMNAGNYSEAKALFNSLTTLKSDYLKEPLMCDARIAEQNGEYIKIIAALYAIQIEDYDYAYLYSPSGDEKLIADAYFDPSKILDIDSIRAIDAIVNPEDFFEEALADSAIKGLKRQLAISLVDKLELEAAIAIFEEISDFGDSSLRLQEAKDLLASYNKKYEEAQAYYDKGEYYKAMAAWREIANWKDSSAKAAQCEQPMPANGSMKTGSGSITMTIKAPASRNALLRIYNSSNEVVAQIFVAAGSSSTIKVNPGTYTMKAAYGDKWYGDIDLFGGEGKYIQLKNGSSTEFTLKKNYKYTLTLATGSTGNVGSDGVSGGASGM